jgi:hypothetical protein
MRGHLNFEWRGPTAPQFDLNSFLAHSDFLNRYIYVEIYEMRCQALLDKPSSSTLECLLRVNPTHTEIRQVILSLTTRPYGTLLVLIPRYIQECVSPLPERPRQSKKRPTNTE